MTSGRGGGISNCEISPLRRDTTAGVPMLKSVPANHLQVRKFAHLKFHVRKSSAASAGPPAFCFRRRWRIEQLDDDLLAAAVGQREQSQHRRVRGDAVLKAAAGSTLALNAPALYLRDVQRPKSIAEWMAQRGVGFEQLVGAVRQKPLRNAIPGETHGSHQECQ